jgi:hypothetical protein
MAVPVAEAVLAKVAFDGWSVSGSVSPRSA